MSAHPPARAEMMQMADPRGPTLVEVAEEGQFYVDAIVVGVTIVPGFVFCVPGLLFAVVPVVALGVLAAAAGLVVLVALAPVRVGWRIARRLRHGLAARRAPRALTVRRRPQPVSPSAQRRPADATMASSPQVVAQEISHPTTRSSRSRR